MLRFAGGLVLLAALSACSTFGVQTGPVPASTEFEPEMEICLCVYQGNGISDERTQTILAAIREEFAPQGLNVTVPWIRPWQRPAFDQKGITRDVARRPLEAPCDRILALVGRDARDFLWGAFLPEILGAVETRTHTKGYVVAEVGSLNQVLTFQSPVTTAVHEFYHLLGVGHGIDKGEAFAQVRRIKALALRNRLAGRDFFPAMTEAGRIYTTRAAVDRRFGILPPDRIARADEAVELVKSDAAGAAAVP